MPKILTIGEIMLRLSTLDNQRLSESNQLAVHFGGAEANTAVSLANFGHQVKFASKVPNHVLGIGAKQHLSKYGVNITDLLVGGERLGVYYLETGAGLRSTSVIYDRKCSSFAQMTELEWDVDELFKEVDLFHLSGITPAVSSQWEDWVIYLLQEAKKRQITVSLDINYREKLWSVSACSRYIQRIAKYVDWCSAGRLDALSFFNIPEKPEKDLSYYYTEVKKMYPNIKIFYSTTREVLSASHNRLQGNLFMGDTFYQSEVIDISNIVDRVGGGDAFTAGIIHGLRTEMSPQKTIDFATNASALKHSVKGDCNQFSAEEVEQLLDQVRKDVNR